MRSWARYLLVLGLAAALPALAVAQQQPVPAAPGGPKGDSKKAGGDKKSGNDDKSIEITADNGIEWDRASHMYIARGNARVTRGDQTILADRITAYHRGEGTTKSDIYRVDAEGSVRIANGDSVITGDRGVYDNDNKVARLTGRNLTMTDPQSKLTARDSLEYWDEKRMAVARGNVVVIRGNEEMRADQIVAYFEPKNDSTPDPKTRGSNGKQRVARYEAYGHVYIASCQGYAHADKGLYDPNTGTAVLTGNVRLTRGREQVNGETVETNTRTGFARVIAGAGGRVQATIEPNKDASTPDSRPTDRPGAAPCSEEAQSPPGSSPKQQR